MFDGARACALACAIIICSVRADWPAHFNVIIGNPRTNLISLVNGYCSAHCTYINSINNYDNVIVMHVLLLSCIEIL